MCITGRRRVEFRSIMGLKRDSTEDWSALAVALGRQLGTPLTLHRATTVSGGCIHHAWRLESSRGDLFAKSNRADRLALLEAEQEALHALHEDGSVRVPRPLATLVVDKTAWLILEYLPLAPLDQGTATQLGHALARLHSRQRERFGWAQDNFIGTTPQPNGFADGWVRFYREQRLGHQWQLAHRDGLTPILDPLQRLMAELDHFFTDYRPHPALLHGDLWGGNAATCAGEPVLFDPASYHGDREADLAMTELFGGFPPAFYAAYDAVLPRDPGYRVRRDLYNLYHVLNHHHLFGGGYGTQAGQMVQRLLAELR